MNRHFSLPACLCAFTLITLFAAAPALADPPSWAGGNKESKHGKKGGERAETRPEPGRHYFDDANRRAINDYYGPRFRAGKCPPGLAKKQNGCLPPGQAKKWAIGQPLPPDLHPYSLPYELRNRLPPPPQGHRYVRVASDILLIAIGTSMVVDAIEDIGR